MDVRRIVAGVGRTCIAAGVLILLFVAYQLWGTGFAEARSQDRLRSDLLEQLGSPTTTTTSVSSSTVPGETTTSSEPTAADLPPTPAGEAIAIIRIPKIGVDKAVVEGVGVPDLKKGPGHYPKTPLPGQPGNAAIAGHRTTYGAPFFRLNELQPGDPIFVTTRQGQFTYRVKDSEVVSPSQTSVLNPSKDNLLTLTTCNPRYSASQRLVVVSELGSNPAPAPPPTTTTSTVPGTKPPPTTLPAEPEGLSGDRSARFPALAWGFLAALIWLVTWLLSKRWGRVPAYAMGAPVFFVVLFIFFENFARILPANF